MNEDDRLAAAMLAAFESIVGDEMDGMRNALAVTRPLLAKPPIAVLSRAREFVADEADRRSIGDGLDGDYWREPGEVLEIIDAAMENAR